MTANDNTEANMRTLEAMLRHLERNVHNMTQAQLTVRLRKDFATIYELGYRDCELRVKEMIR